MKKRFSALAAICVALVAIATVFSFVFYFQPFSKISASKPTPASEDSSSTSASTSSQPSAPISSSAPEGQYSAANLPDQPRDSSTPDQNVSANRVTKNTAAAASAPRRTIADILEGVDLAKPGERDLVVQEMQKLENEKKALAVARARELGLPIRLERPDGTVQEVVDLDSSGHPLYFTTHNVSAAISTGANVLNAAPYNLRGSNSLILGVWGRWLGPRYSPGIWRPSVRP